MVKITPSFEIEVETIDNDHRRLVDFTNQITAAIDDQQYAECARLVPDFIALSKRHFAREEALLDKFDYPGIDQHRQHHTGLDDKMETMLTLAGRVEDNRLARETLRREVFFFLMDDVINEDMDFKKFLVDARSKEK